MRKAFAKTLIELAEQDPRIVLLTGDMGFMVLEPFAERFPDRFFNVGVAEANAVGLATGLAEAGFIPYTYSIATFALIRPFEHIRNGPVLHQLPVRIVGIGGGFEYGQAGHTHHAQEDLALARTQPGLGVIVPADPDQTHAAIKATYDLPQPIYYRISKLGGFQIPNLRGQFELGKLTVIREGQAALLLCCGSISREVWEASQILSARGIAVTLAVVSSLSPAPLTQLGSLLQQFPHVFSVEEGFVTGGLGSLVAEVIAQNGLACRLRSFGVKHNIPETTGSMTFLRERSGLTPSKMALQIEADLDC